MMKLKKKTLAGAALLSGAIIGFVGVTAIEFACRKDTPLNKQKPKVNPQIEKYLPWLKQQHFETEYAYYIKFYHDLGFHILLPDNRAHGESEGQYIGFGWLDRLDCIQWIHQVKDYFHKDLQIVLHGISMGSATVLMASGEELPSDVKCIISDCGFTSVLDEFKHELHQRHIPASLVLPTATLLSKKRVGYSFKEASTIEQVKKSKTPTLFIHGDRDNFVPTYMVYDLYNACSADKDLLIVEGAGHAQSYLVDPKLCESTIIEFMNKYIKE